ncbi:hypothetical protein [Lysinibacillus pakistanensis]|uniref:hypothetical protein n=1 Tax=Lysinibacillus pakistanensis TaxID=759811 RepID=UPI0025A2BA17|nr:hypothetical protein [Lysinibacillus pakistanensis]
MSRFTTRSRVSSVTLNVRGVTQSTLQSTTAHSIFFWHFTQINSDKFEDLAITILCKNGALITFFYVNAERQ